MSYFSELLDSCIYESGLSVNELSRLSGINRTYISKIRSGARILHNEAKMRSLVKSLRCSSEQEELLMREYQIEAFGRERYETIQAVKDLIQSMAYLPNRPYIQSHTEQPKFPGAIYGKNDVNFVLQSILAQETAKEGGHICIVAQHEFEDLSRIVPNICYNQSSLHVEHITCLRSSNVQGANLYNLHCLKDYIPAIMCGCKYDLLYYYGEQSHINAMSMLPHLVVTGSHAMTISYNGDIAILHDGGSEVDAFARVFNDMKANCNHMVSKLSVDDRFDQYSQWYAENAKRESTLIGLSNSPAFTPFITSDMLDRTLTEKGMAARDAIARILELFQNDYTDNMIKFFSLDGLHSFARHGRISGIPECLYTTLSMEDRLELIKIWQKQCRNSSDYTCLAIQPGQINIPDNIFIEATSIENIMLSYTHPMHEDAFCMILEKSIAGSIYDFLDYLHKGNVVYDEEYTLNAVDEVIKLLES